MMITLLVNNINIIIKLNIIIITLLLYTKIFAILNSFPSSSLYNMKFYLFSEKIIILFTSPIFLYILIMDFIKFLSY